MNRGRFKHTKIRRGFTLIELIIVVVIIGILALIAIPRYFANVAKAQKSQAYTTLDVIRQALLGYYAVYGTYPINNVWPIVVTIDGDTIMSVSNPSTASRSYYHQNGVGGGSSPGDGCWVYFSDRTPSCFYQLYISGKTLQTCTP